MAEDPPLGLESERMLCRHAPSSASWITIRLRAVRNKIILEVLAIVIYSERRLGMGVSFTQLSPEQKSILENWLADVATNGHP